MPSTRFGLGVENDRADVGRDDRTYLARPNSSGAGKNYRSERGQLTTNRIGKHAGRCNAQSVSMLLIATGAVLVPQVSC